MGESILNFISVIYILIMFLMFCELRYPLRKTVALALLLYSITGILYMAVVWAGLPPALAAAVFVSIPTFFMCAALSRYRDFRYVFTFCSVDICGMMILMTANLVRVLIGGSLFFQMIVCTLLYIPTFFIAYKVRGVYLETQKSLTSGWGSLAILSIIFYIMFYVVIGYPEPLIQRLEYAPIVWAYSAVVVAVYFVLFQFVGNLRKNDEFARSEQMMKMQLELQDIQLRQQELYYELAYIDPLTKLYNRAALSEDEMKIAQDWDRNLPLSCILFDLNNLKRTNDTLGHNSGDRLICGLAEALRQVFDPEFKIYRVGGDEFVVLLPGIPEMEAGCITEQVRDVVERFNEYWEPRISVAIGCATLTEEDLHRQENICLSELSYLLSEADKAMYMDKKRCRDTAREASCGVGNGEGQDEH